MALFLIGFTAVLLTIGSTEGQQKNVCKTFEDYYLDMQQNENCYYNSDADLTIPGIIKKHGYPLESYQATTKDGYILTVFRIQHGRNFAGNGNPGAPVFLQHGIGLNCGAFVNRGQKSLAFILADAGFDVWLGNFRGTMYSKGHANLKNTTTKYWDYTFHEMGVYDLPAQLDLVSSINNRSINYVGYSMGTTASYIYATTYPEAAFRRLKVIISLAPIAYLGHTETPLRFLTRFWPYVEPYLQNLDHGRLEGRPLQRIKDYCLPLPFQMMACQSLPFLLFGFNYQQNDPETLPVTALQNKEDVSVKLLGHYVQFLRQGKFRQFDYGPAGNLRKYGFPVPPEYDLSKMTVPNYLMRSANDFLATKRNVEELYTNLPKRAKRFPIFVVEDEDFNHSDFILARDVKSLLYNHVVKFLTSFDS